MRPPRRLLEDSALPQTLRADLTRTRARPYPYDARSGLAALQGVLAAAATSAAAASAAASSAPASAAVGPAAAVGSAAAAPAGGALLGAAGTKIGLAAAGAALVAASVLVTTGQTVPRHAPQAAAQRFAAAPASRTGRAQAIAAPVQELDPGATPAPRSERAVPAPVATVHADQAAALRREIAQLGRVKAAAARDPARAYQLAQQGHRAFARGMLRHEREGLAVLALFALERREHAERRAQAFLARYPSSPLRAGIEQQLRAGPDP